MRVSKNFSLIGFLALAACTQPQPTPDASDASSDATADASDSAVMDVPSDLPPFDGSVPDRMPDARTPLPGPCDPVDALRCTLPWPSNRYTVQDTSRATGLHLQLDVSQLNALDSPASLNRTDGFSRVTPVMVAVPSREIDMTSLGDSTTAAIRLMVATPGPNYGQLIPLRMSVVTNNRLLEQEALIVAYPRKPLDFNTDYVAVLMDTVRSSNNITFTADQPTRAALGLQPPVSLDEEQMRAYHAPTRSVLARAQIDPNHVLRVWDFTTRSRDDATRDLVSMRAAAVNAVTMNSVQATITRMTITTDTNSPVLVAFEGQLSGLPTFVGTNKKIMRNASGAPESMGTHTAPFRVMVPRTGGLANGNYRFVMFGHGTGGNFNDDSFDLEIATNNAAKVGIEFKGLTEADVVPTLLGLQNVLDGSENATDILIGAVADGMAVQAAMSTVIADAVAAPTVMGMTNPAANRRPDATVPIWAGGSLGGTMGLVYTNVEPSIRGAVLNVPGAAWSHFLVFSDLFSLGATPILQRYRQNEVNLHLALAMSQSNWDRGDGANFVNLQAGRTITFLLQESIGDPILPNIGSDMVGSVLNAVRIGAEIQSLPLLPQAQDATVGQAGFTQFRVPRTVTRNYDIHGFAARSGPAGDAAREQILNFVRSVWENNPRVTLPSLCAQNTPAGSCDFVNR